MAVAASAYGASGSIVVNSLVGDSAGGTVKWTAGPFPSSGPQVILAFAVPSLNTPNAVFAPASNTATLIRAYVVPTIGGFTLSAGTLTGSSASYEFTYQTDV